MIGNEDEEWVGYFVGSWNNTLYQFIFGLYQLFENFQVIDGGGGWIYSRVQKMVL